MNLGTIPSENVVLVSAVLSAFIAYQSRLNGLETARDREQYLNFRLQEVTKFSDTWGITFDNIRVHEDSGFLYRVKKFITGSISGESSVVVRYKKSTIPGSFWDTDAAKAIMDAYRIEVDHLGTDDHLDPTVARFTFDSLDDSDISGFFDALIEVEKDMRPPPNSS